MGRSRNRKSVNDQHAVSGLTIGLPVLLTLISFAVALGTGYGVLAAHVIRNTLDMRDYKVSLGAITDIRIAQAAEVGAREKMQRQLVDIEALLEGLALDGDPMTGKGG